MSKLKTIREARGVSQAKLASASGVSIKAIQAYEQGFRDIRKAEAWKVINLAAALEAEVNEIVE